MSLFTNSNDAAPRTRGVSAFFATRTAAEQAKADIVAAGVSSEAIKITDGRGTVTGRSTAAEPAARGIVDTVKNAFASDAPTEDAERERRGFVVTAHVPETRFAQARSILAREGEVAQVQG